jgi:hypothetical protein
MTNCEDPIKEAARRKKLSEAHTGKILTEETKQKMSRVRRGKPHSKEHSENIGRALKGRVFTPEWREKLRQARLGKKATPETRKKMSESRSGENNSFFGRSHSDETKRYVSDYRIKNGIASGKNNPMYINGSSYEPYCKKFNPEFRRRVRSFFKDTCQMCGHVHTRGEKNMTVHHVNFRKDSCCSTDVVPLFVTVCTGEKGNRSCHAKTNHDRDYWEICFTQLIRNKYDGKCYLTKEEYYKTE